jgi:hypothetical protein
LRRQRDYSEVRNSSRRSTMSAFFQSGLAARGHDGLRIMNNGRSLLCAPGIAPRESCDGVNASPLQWPNLIDTRPKILDLEPRSIDQNADFISS